MKNNARVNLKINEPAGSTRGQQNSISQTAVDEAMDDFKI